MASTAWRQTNQVSLDRGQGATKMMHRRISVGEVFIDAGSGRPAFNAKAEYRSGSTHKANTSRKTHDLKAAIGAAQRSRSSVALPSLPHVAIANPAFVPDAWRIQGRPYGGAGQGPTKCSCITPMLDTHARASDGSDHRYERSFLCHHEPPLGART